MDMPTMPEEDEITDSPKGEGYSIRIDVLPSGYRVSDPEPLPAEPSDATSETEAGEPSEAYEVVPDLATAIKHVLAVIKAHPLDESPESQMDEGFAD